MKYDDIHPSMRRALGVFEGFRKLGFPSELIFIWRATQTGHISALVRPSVGKQYAIQCGQYFGTQEMFEAKWQAAVAAWNDESDGLSEEDRQRIWQESAVFKEPVQLIMSMQKKGITIPSMRWSGRTPSAQRASN